MKNLKTLAALAVVAGMCSPGLAVDPEAVALYNTKCKTCHAPDGSGDTAAGKKLNVRDFRLPEVMKQKDDQLLAILNDGKNKMPAYKSKLTDEQRKKLAGYVRELGSKK